MYSLFGDSEEDDLFGNMSDIESDENYDFDEENPQSLLDELFTATPNN